MQPQLSCFNDDSRCSAEWYFTLFWFDPWQECTCVEAGGILLPLPSFCGAVAADSMMPPSSQTVSTAGGNTLEN